MKLQFTYQWQILKSITIFLMPCQQVTLLAEKETQTQSNKRSKESKDGRRRWIGTPRLELALGPTSQKLSNYDCTRELTLQLWILEALLDTGDCCQTKTLLMNSIFTLVILFVYKVWNISHNKGACLFLSFMFVFLFHYNVCNVNPLTKVLLCLSLFFIIRCAT